MDEDSCQFKKVRLKRICACLLLTAYLGGCGSEIKSEYELGKRYQKMGGRYLDKAKRYERMYRESGDRISLARAEENYKKAEVDWERAISHYKRVIDMKICAYEKTAYLYQRLGELLMRREFYPEAIRYYKQALELKPNSSLIYCDLGVCFANLGKHSEEYLDTAISCYKRAIKLSEDYVEPYYGLALIYFYKKDKKQEGISILEKAVKISPTFTNGYIALAKFYYELKDYRRSINRYQDAISTNPRARDNADYYFNIGVMYRMLKSDELAIENFRKALKVDKNHRASKEELRRLGVIVSDRFRR
ncbi:MAG: tetratricopeptide repeat protein [bacterium]|nr:tetratricopeptide repeat protein [bacterium]